jgi:hypothetical protein
MGTVTDKPTTRLDSAQLADALTREGFRIAKATLDTKACRGGGPPFRKFGRRRIYEWDTSIEWAQSQLSEPICSTAERDALTQN